MKKLIMMAGMALCGLTAGAQSVPVLKAQEKLAKQDFAAAEQILKEGIDDVNAKWEKKKLKDPAALPDTKKLAELHNKLGEVYGLQFNPELMKAAQGQPLDTAKFCTMLDKTVESYSKSAEYDFTPDAKGKAKPRFEANNRKMLGSMLDYYYYSGVFKNQNGDTKGSCEEFKKFINLRKSPIFSEAQQDSIYQAKKKIYDQAAFNVSLLYYQSKDWDNALASIDDAMGDPANLKDAYIIKQQAYLEKGDTAAWVKTLEEAVERVEDNTNYMEQLIYYYTQKNDAASANALADGLIAKNPESKSAWYMKGCTKLNLENDYMGAREYFQKAIDIDPAYPEANLNMAYCFMNEVRKNRDEGKYKYAFRSSYTSKEKDAYMKELHEIQDYYRKAMPYAEKVREAKPDNVKLWGPALSMIYANLSMDDKAKEVDNLISAANKQ